MSMYTCTKPTFFLDIIYVDYLARRNGKLASFYFKKWKSKSIYQVLLAYRAKLFQELTYFSQQVRVIYFKPI